MPDVIVDGELVALDADGRPDFERLSRGLRRSKRISIDFGARADPACLWAFDILELAGEDVRAKPLLDRKALLQDVIADSKRIRLAGHVHERGVMLFQVADSLQLESIVAKRADAPYPGGRSSGWLKIQTAHGRHVDEERREWSRP